MIYKEQERGRAPCSESCPIGIDIPRYIRWISQGDYAKALAVIREKLPFPSVCGRVCFHPCEEGCKTHHSTESVAINSLKRFVTEQTPPILPLPPRKWSGKRVAVVGSGPAGLTAAYYLTRLGHRVVVFEALPVPGGMMRVGIPDYRLPRQLLEKEIDQLKAAGFEVRTDSRVNSLDQLIAQGYDAVLLAVGAHGGQRLPIPGSDLDEVFVSTEFLKEANLGKKIQMGKKVVVLGGGNVAFDCARTALRLGAAEAHITCLEPRDALVASPDEVTEGLEEGVVIHPARTCIRIASDEGRVSGVACLRVRSFTFDSKGKVHIDPIEGSEHVLPADTVIFAVGQFPDLGIVKGISEIEVTARRTLAVDPGTLATGRRGIFAAGDVVTGMKFVIDAIAAGRLSATSIDHFLGGSGSIEEVFSPGEEKLPPYPRGMPVGRRIPMPKRLIEERLNGFCEVQIGFDHAMALREANRCLWCEQPILADPTTCVGCLRCSLTCSLRFEGGTNPYYAKVSISPPDRSQNLGEAQISFADDCDLCGSCVRACTYGSLTRGRGKQVAVDEEGA